MEGLVPTSLLLSLALYSDSRERTSVLYHACAGRLGTLKFNIFRWRSIREFHILPKVIRMLSSCSVVAFTT